MKKTVKINIKETYFYIDEDAYDVLQLYMDSIKSHFKNQEDGDEIIEDIESRILEYIIATLKSHEVINLQDVNIIINKIGKPYEIEDDRKEEEYSSAQSSINKRLYRNVDNSVIGGVCSGLAIYFNMDVSILRVIFVILILFNGLGLLLYLILWIAIPPARTLKEKQEMKETRFDKRKFEKNVKNEYENVKKGVNDFQHTDQFESARDGVVTLFAALGKIILGVLKFVVILIGISLVIVGIVLFLSVTGIFIFNDSQLWDFWIFRNFYYPDLSDMFNMFNGVAIMGILITLIIIIPIFILIYWGFKRAFSLKYNDKALGIIFFVIWILSFFGAITYYFSSGRQLISHYHDTQSMYLNLDGHDTLYLDVIYERYNDYDDDYMDMFFEYGTKYENGDKYLIGMPTVQIIRTDRENVELTINKMSLGENKFDAEGRASRINYKWTKEDSLILLSEYYKIREGKKWTLPKVELDLEIPYDVQIIAEPELKKMIPFKNRENIIWQY